MRIFEHPSLMHLIMSTHAYMNERIISSLRFPRFYYPRGYKSHQQHRRFSHYANYSKTFKTYDNVRRPIALDIVRSGFNRSARAQGITIDKMHVLDAGCGTGNYIQALEGDVQSMVGLDYNCDMLQQAQNNLKLMNDTTLLLGNIMNSPYLTVHLMLCF